MLRLHLHAGLLPPDWLPGCPSPELDEAGAQLGAGNMLPRSAGGRGWCGVGGEISGGAATLFVLNEGQDVGEGECLTALAAG